MKDPRGGRRNALLTPDEERALLWQHLILDVFGMQRALQQQTGRKPHRSTIYRIARRHGWKAVRRGGILRALELRLNRRVSPGTLYTIARRQYVT